MKEKHKIPNFSKLNNDKLNKTEIANICKELELPTITVFVIGNNSKIFEYNYVNKQDKAKKIPRYPECSKEIYEKVRYQLCEYCAKYSLPPDVPYVVVDPQGSVCYCYCK